MTDDKKFVIIENRKEREISQKEFEEISNDKKKKLIKEEDDRYRILEKLYS